MATASSAIGSHPALLFLIRGDSICTLLSPTARLMLASQPVNLSRASHWLVLASALTAGQYCILFRIFKSQNL